MKKHKDDIAIVVNNELVYVNPKGQADYEAKKKAKKARRKASRSKEVRHTANDQVCFVVDNEYVCVDRH